MDKNNLTAYIVTAGALILALWLLTRAVIKYVAVASDHAGNVIEGQFDGHEIQRRVS